MSTNRECVFIEVEPKQWFYVLENGNAPKDASDWYDFATAYGSFPTFDKALEHLGSNHANPGRFSQLNYHSELTISVSLQKLIDEAESKPHRNR